MHLLSGTLRRMSPTVWATLEDDGHCSRGIASVELRPDRVRVRHTFTAWKVSSLQVTPDDAFACADVRVGASVGFAYTDVYFYMGASEARVNPALLSRVGANVFITGWFEEHPEVAP